MLYASITPYRTGWLEPGGGHQIYWEISGNPEGWPVVVVHGGPGGGSTERHRRWFHPHFFRIITFDQRGCGRSRPHASIERNTTDHLVGDLESLRVMLGVDRWILMGLSWGSALAIAYAEAHPHRVDAMVLCGVFTARRFEREFLYPTDVAQAFHALVTCGLSAVELAGARAWCAREDAVDSLSSRQAPDDRTVLARARIGTHYFLNQYFLGEGSLLADATRLCNIPGVIVHGHEDAVTPPMSAHDLHRAWPGSRLNIVDDAGHSWSDPPLMRALIDATDSLLPIARARSARRAARPTAPTPRPSVSA